MDHQILQKKFSSFLFLLNSKFLEDKAWTAFKIISIKFVNQGDYFLFFGESIL